MNWLRRRLWERRRAQLRQGLSPKAMAWSLPLGLAGGGSRRVVSSTGLCTLRALVFRLNQWVGLAVFAGIAAHYALTPVL